MTARRRTDVSWPLRCIPPTKVIGRPIGGGQVLGVRRSMDEGRDCPTRLGAAASLRTGRHGVTRARPRTDPDGGELGKLADDGGARAATSTAGDVAKESWCRRLGPPGRLFVAAWPHDGGAPS